MNTENDEAYTNKLANTENGRRLAREYVAAVDALRSCRVPFDVEPGTIAEQGVERAIADMHRAARWLRDAATASLIRA